MKTKKYVSAFMIACAMMLVPASAEANTLIPKEAIQLKGEWADFKLEKNQNNRHMIQIREAGDLSVKLMAFSGMNYVRLFDEEMVKLYDKDLYGSESAPAIAEIDFDLLPGVYYLQYECTNGANSEGDYRVKAEFSPAGNNETEPNDTNKKAMPLETGKAVTGFLTKALGTAAKPSEKVDTVDYYSFVVDEDQKMKITYTPEKKNGNFQLFNADMVTQRRQNVSSSPYVCEMNLKAGTYYICISSLNEAGKYTLLVEPEQKAPQKGDVYTDSQTGIKYQVISVKGKEGTAAVSEMTDKEVVSAAIPEALKVGDYTIKVTTISPDAFAECTKLKTVSVSENVTKISSRAFSGCTSLRTVSGAQNVTNIGVKAFYKCEDLKQIGNRKNKVTLTNVKLIGKQAFAGCESIKRVNIPSTNLIRINTSAFSKCENLTIVTMASEKMTTIGKNAFNGCSSLKRVTMKTEKLRVVGKNAFKGVVDKCLVKVPAANVKVYKQLLAKEKMGTQLKIRKF